MSLLKHAKQYLANQSKYAHLNAFISLTDSTKLLSRAEASSNDDLHDVRDRPIAIKDNICTKDLKTTAASGILKNFRSPYDATVVELLHDAGAIVVGKTNMDEFGMGSHSTHSFAGSVKMQRYKGEEEKSVGGSSGGSALAIATGQCWAALGTDTGGSVRLPGYVRDKPPRLDPPTNLCSRLHWYCGLQAKLRVTLEMGRDCVCEFSRHCWDHGL